jgi:DNA gyrase subunit B
MSASAARKEQSEQEYTAESIEILTGLEAVRRRPGMYIGDTDGSGLHNMVYYWVESFAIPDACATTSPHVGVTLNANGSITVEHKGRGLPVASPPEAELSTAEAMLTHLVCDCGLPIVNALSSRLELMIWSGGKEYSLAYENGEPLYPLDLVGTSLGKSGVHATFLPSTDIFATTEFDYPTLERRFRELAFLNPGLHITLNDRRKRRKKSANFHFDQGLADFVRYLDWTNKPLVGPVTVTGTQDDITVDAALLWNADCHEDIVCYTNHHLQKLGGTHCESVRHAVKRAINDASRMNDRPAMSNTACQGLICVLSVKANKSEYAVSAGEELISPEVGEAAQNTLTPALTAWFEKHPSEAKTIIQKIVETAAARKNTNSN